MSRWLSPDRKLPPFRLLDINRKIFESEKLAGKTLILPVWATWSGPCHLQLPRVQKLQAALEGREDIALLTLNADDDIAAVRKYVEERGYTFRVLNATVYVNQVIMNLSVPRLWIVDGSGKWVSEQVGFDLNDDDWEADVLRRAEAAAGLASRAE